MSYTKQNFIKGQILKADHLNAMDAGIEANDIAINQLTEEIADLKENGGGVSVGANYVSYEPQEPTSAEKLQVMNNIGITEYKASENLFDYASATPGRFDDEGNYVGDNQWCISDYLPVSVGDERTSTTFVSGSADWANFRRVFGYDENKEQIGLLVSNKPIVTIEDERVKYIRVQILATQAPTCMIRSIGGKPNAYVPFGGETSLSAVANRFIHGEFSTTGGEIGKIDGYYSNDITFVGEKMWSFEQESGAESGVIKVLDVDKSTWRVLSAKSIPMDFGHGNTIDYRAETDCLIFGNGSGEYGEIGAFYIIKNPSRLETMSSVNLADVAITFDCSAYDFGDKLNICWGHENNGRHDIAIMITDDNRVFRVIQLGKGANEFDHGSLIAGTADTDFNGTFRIISTHTLDDGRTGETNANNCNQGSAWYNGKLYVGVGHRPECYWIVTLKANGTAEYEEKHTAYYDATGAGATGATEGICFVNGYMLINNAANTGNGVSARRV